MPAPTVFGRKTSWSPPAAAPLVPPGRVEIDSAKAEKYLAAISASPSPGPAGEN
jgi:hypothetical protein